MEIILAKAAGFCFGVKRAVEAVNTNIKKNNLKTFGPIIHNEQVVKEFEVQGVQIAHHLDDTHQSTVIIRSHGVSPQDQAVIQQKAYEVIDATCPYVKRIHKLVKKYFDLGYTIILFGNSNHPEMVGVNGWCENQAVFVKSVDEAQSLSTFNKVFLASQTTMSSKVFKEIIEIIKEKTIEDFQVVNTICSATEERQDAARELAKQVDKVIVVGGYSSSNTQKLVSICKEYCDYVIHIETAEEIPLKDFKITDKVGITAGASTPDWIINEVINRLHS